MKKLNNKGYMLVEIILVFVITFALLYFVMDLVIRLKNKNDDLLVETVIKSDQSIISNKLMSYMIEEEGNFDCDKLKNGINGNVIKYGDDLIDIVDEMGTVGSDISCEIKLGKVSVVIPIVVEQNKEENFDGVVEYKYDIGDLTAPECVLSVSGSTINADCLDNEGGSGLDNDMIILKNTSWILGDINNYKTGVGRTGDFPFVVYDMAGNSRQYNVNISNISKNCSGYQYEDSGGCYNRTCWNGAYRDTCHGSNGVTYPCGNQEIECGPKQYGTPNYYCSNGYSRIENNSSYCYKIG